MNLMTKQLEDRFAELGRQEEAGNDAVVVAKFFNPSGRSTWYASEYYPADREFYGYCVGPFDKTCDELGYFSLDELQGIRGPFGLGIERDINFEEITLRAAMALHGKEAA